jgi:hypothetical protein
MRMIGLVLLCGGAAAVGACTDGLVCTTSVEPAIVVEIRDDGDDAPLAAGARGAVRDGAYVDSLRPYGGTGQGDLLSRAAADERSGTYMIEVVHPGYATWTQGGVQVVGDACHVATVRLVARLLRIG